MNYVNFWIHPTTLTVINLEEIIYVMPAEEADSQQGDVEVHFKNGASLFLYEKDGEPKSFFNYLAKANLRH